MTVFAVLVLIAKGPGLLGAEKSELPIVELPTITVTDNRELPPPESWRYATIAGFEVLTNASERETRKLLHDFQLFNTALDVVWQGLQEKRAVPISLIICGPGQKFGAFMPREEIETLTGRVSLFLKDREQAAIVLDFASKTIDLSGISLANAQAPVGRVTEDGPDPASADAIDFSVDHYQQLYREYVRFLLTRANPRLPAWFEEGLAQLFMRMKVERTTITFAKLDDSDELGITPGSSDRDFNAATVGNAIIPLDRFFAVPHDSTIAGRPLGNRWAKQAQGLVHLWIFGEKQRYQKGLIEFLRRLQKEPPSEKLFEECFKVKYKAMLLTYRTYSEFTVYKFYEWRLPKKQSLPEPARIVFRDATDSEVGRIKGEAFRLAGHADAAHTAIIAPYIRGERDARLLAAIGLDELAAGREERARKFFEAALEAKVERPRAYLELAKLRAKQHLGEPAAYGGALNAAQTRDVIAPLLIAHSQPPPMPEVYELMAGTLIQSSEPVTREQLDVLFAGVNLFPRRLAIAYQTAILCIRAGEVEGARGLINRGLLITTDQKIKAIFTELKDSLPPPATAPAAATPSAQPAKK